MVKPLATRPSRLTPQGVRVIMDLAAQISDAIHLEVGEPNFPTPAHVVEAAIQAARDGYTKYTPNAGIPRLRQAIAAKMARVNGLQVDPAQVVVTPGGVAAISSVLTALVDPGEEVLVPDPSWPNAIMWLNVLGARPVPYTLRQEHEFLPVIEELEALVTPATKALVINSPGNPTGAVFPPELMRRLVEFAQRHDLYLISDEIYEQIVFEGEHCSPARFDTDGRVITLSGMSKAYAMTGWRIGYLVAARPIVELVARLQEPVTSCSTGVSQVAAAAALEGPQDVVEEMRRSYQRRRDRAVEVLREFGLFRYAPHGAFYVMVDVRGTGRTSEQFAREVLQAEHVAVAPGTAFGASGEGFVRVSLATEEGLLIEGLRRLCRFAKACAAASATTGAAPARPA